jgi:hypothetical protein
MSLKLISSLTPEMKERFEAFVDGAIERPGVVDYVPTTEAGTVEALAYIESKYLSPLTGGAPSGDRFSKVKELKQIVVECRFAEIAYADETPEKAEQKEEFAQKIGIGKDVIQKWKVAEDKKFQQWKARRPN